jgi:hypothetical protein
MNKLKLKLKYSDVMIYLLVLLIFFYIVYRLVSIFISYITSTKEGLFNAKSLTTQLLCRNDRCMEGCKEPTKITERCGKAIYRDIENKCYRLCPYICEGEDSPCIANDCCVGCKQKKFEVPCNDLIPKGADPGISTDGNFAPFFATGYADIEHDPRATQKAINVYKMMKDVSAVYDKHSGELLNNNDYECTPNITGTFTECGPQPAIRMNYQ